MAGGSQTVPNSGEEAQSFVVDVHYVRDTMRMSIIFLFTARTLDRYGNLF